MKRMSKLFQVVSEKKISYLIFIFLVSLILRLVYISLFEAEIGPLDDPSYYLRIAQNILDGQGYREVNLLAYRPPLYAYFIAGIFSVFENNLDAVRIIQALLASIMCFGIFFIGRIFVTTRTGLIAAGFCAVYPHLIHYSVQLWSEQLFMFFIILAFLSFLFSERKASVWLRIVTGILLGLSALTREAGILVLFGFLIWLNIVHKNVLISLKRWWILALFAFITVAPWTIRNYLVFDKLVPITTNGGINFYMGNNPGATGTFRWAIPPGARWNEESPNGFFETQASSLGYKYGFQFIKDNPGQFLKLLAKRAFFLFQPPYFVINFEESKVETISKIIWLAMYIILFVFALVIGPFHTRFEPKFLSLSFITVLMLALPYLITYAATRYRLSMIPFMAMAAAVVADRIFSARKE